ncbi:hypothetical protein EDD27_9424 [Nonomuraea polychroma]|uniref:Uncharacterized protein n=1 Tax=Nonomuraea polychroma TaxID=46176 RepID=A0A438MLA8_9ACTN|nr:hypothetical protein [Nonomuraea polychroma]RVX46534.1 hypothetical protein EDD27_9424 [Nonomuraea polychroma]
MSSQKIRSVAAAAALAAGVIWLAVAAPQASACNGLSVATSDSAARDCREGRGLHLHDGPPGAGMRSPETVPLSTAIGRLARQAGLSGLAAGNPAPGLADLGGMVATWGMPSPASASPELFPLKRGPAGMEDLSTAAHVPALPSLPGRPLMERVSNEMPIGHGPQHGTAPATEGSRGPEKPTHAIGTEAIGELLPKAVPGLGNTSVLPGAAGTDGLSVLVNGVSLR